MSVGIGVLVGVGVLVDVLVSVLVGSSVLVCAIAVSIELAEGAIEQAERIVSARIRLMNFIVTSLISY